MTEDRHVRLRANGTSEELPAVSGLRVRSADPTEDGRLEAVFIAHNRRIAETLNAKGFGLQGDEPGAVRMNRRLRLGGKLGDSATHPRSQRGCRRTRDLGSPPL